MTKLHDKETVEARAVPQGTREAMDEEFRKAMAEVMHDHGPVLQKLADHDTDLAD